VKARFSYEVKAEGNVAIYWSEIVHSRGALRRTDV
jgi:hypothetical protein